MTFSLCIIADTHEGSVIQLPTCTFTGYAAMAGHLSPKSSLVRQIIDTILEFSCHLFLGEAMKD